MRKTLLLVSFLLLLSGSASASERIIGGKPAPARDWTFFVALSEKRAMSSTNAPFCGASLIQSRWVLTAAHCVLLVNSIRARDIRVNINKSYYGDPTGGILPVERIYTHPRFSFTRDGIGNWDAALLRLGREAQTPPVTLADTPPDPGSRLRLAGFGRTNPRYWGFSKRLLQVDVKKVSSEVCARRWGKNYRGAHMLCTFSVNRGACHGDSGGPLLYQGALAGIVSSGRFDCKKNYLPDVFTDVSSLRGWIDSVTALYPGSSGA